MQSTLKTILWILQCKHRWVTITLHRTMAPNILDTLSLPLPPDMHRHRLTVYYNSINRNQPDTASHVCIFSQGTHYPSMWMLKIDRILQMLHQKDETSCTTKSCPNRELVNRTTTAQYVVNKTGLENSRWEHSSTKPNISNIKAPLSFYRVEARDIKHGIIRWSAVFFRGLVDVYYEADRE